MTDAIDPRLYASSLPPRSQSYISAPQQNPAQPYYLPSPTLHHPPSLPQPIASGNSTLDPALEQASPPGPDLSHDDEEEQDEDGDLDGIHVIPGSNKFTGELKRPRACDSCRGLKVRCDQERPDKSCRRCAKAGRPWYQRITTPPTRKRQKKADSRVAELERKIDALTATLHAHKTATPDLKHNGGLPQYDGNTHAVASPEGAFHTNTLGHDWSSPVTARYSDVVPGQEPAPVIQQGPEPKRRKVGDGDCAVPQYQDAVHRDMINGSGTKQARQDHARSNHSYIAAQIDELISPELAERVFVRYVDEMFPHFPAVPLPAGTTAQELKERNSLLFLSILACSAHGTNDQLVSQGVQQELIKLLKDRLADIIWRDGEKSLEIVQALQITVLWYRPPLHYEQHNLYMMVNCAAVMALDLGLGRKATPNAIKLSTGPFRRFHPYSGGFEARRTFLVCYWLCMNITMMLRRPVLLRWTKYMEESVKILESSPDALPSDKLLCQHVKLARIAEDISIQFCMDDPSAGIAISEPKVIYALKSFEKELQLLRDDNARMGELEPILLLAEDVTNLYLHELALQASSGPVESGSTFKPDSLPLGKRKDGLFGSAHIGALGECLSATHGILDRVLSIPTDSLLTLPVIFCVRSVYAIVCLMKIWVVVANNDEVSSTIRKEELQMEIYMERLVKMFNAIVNRDIQSPHGKFYFVTKRLQKRFASIMENATKTEPPSAESEIDQMGRRRSTCVAGSLSTSQTPLHLLSEVAMVESDPTPLPQQSRFRVYPKQQSQAVLQTHSSHTQCPPQQQSHYSGNSTGGIKNAGDQQQNLDMNYDLTQFGLSVGSEADFSALFVPDSLLMYGPMDPIMQTYGGLS